MPVLLVLKNFSTVDILQDLKIIGDALNKGLESELENCKKSESTCRITRNFAAWIQNKAKFVEIVEQDIRTLPENISLSAVKAETYALIQEKIINPVNKCLKN